ncbi:MAG: pilus assembly protein PilP [Xanthomonadales bacterium]|nr:pilus assembly protein PilP [Xanthomonadales bacterium]
MNKHGKPNRGRLVAALLVLSTFMSACTGGQDDLDGYIAEVKSRPAEPIPPIPPVKTYTPYVYEGQTGRDPFRSSTSEGSDDVAATSSGSGPRPDRDRPREYLEQFELDTLTMVGTFSMADSLWALVQDPDGVVHRVAVGNYLGRNHGRITAIEPMRLEMTELITDGAGGWLVREASMAVDEA